VLDMPPLARFRPIKQGHHTPQGLDKHAILLNK
jgi:hypothetical protein